MKTYITDVTLRDAHQCLIATRLRTEDMLPICPKMDEIGFWAMEVWGGATFDAGLRFLKENPWDRLRALRKALPNTRLSMLLRGQNLLGYRHYADDVIEAFIRLAVDNGVDVFRVFDALNDVRNLETSIKAIKKHKRHAQGAISYTISPVHTIERFIELGKAMAELGCDSLAIKDMAGLLTPVVAVNLYQGLAKATNLPIHIHSHATAGLSSICLYEAVMAGCQHIDTAISSFSGGASHPAAEAMVAALADTNHATELDLNALLEVGDYFKDVRKKYHQFESEAQAIDPRVQVYQVPGGMISNLYNQLKEQDALDKMQQVHEEIPRVRRDLGYPPLVTPTSQIVGTQAFLNVLIGERYKTITNEVKLYCQGKYGKPPSNITPSVRKKAIGNTPVIEHRPADLIKNELAKLKKEVGSKAKSEEDVLTYALFPDIAQTYFEQRDNNALEPEPLLPLSHTVKNKQASEFDIVLHGEQYHVKVAGLGNRGANRQAYYLWVDGAPEEVLVHPLHLEADSHDESTSPKTGAPAKIGPGDVSVTMPGSIVEVKVTVGDNVKAGQTVLVLEAMKMETEIQAPVKGVIKAIHCEKGSKVKPGDVLIQIEPSDKK